MAQAVLGVFDGINFVLDLGGIPYLKKKELRNKIVANGGNVLYSVSKKTDFVVVCSIPDEATMLTYSLVTAMKLGIKIIYTDYIDVSINAGKLGKEGINPHLEGHVSNAFKEGRILAGFGSQRNQNPEKRKQLSKSEEKTVWKFLDPNGPPFHCGSYEIAKFAVLEGRLRNETEWPFCSLEIHTRVVDAEDAVVPRFCVFWHAGVLTESKKDGTGLKNCRFTDSADSALATFNKLYVMYTSPPYSFTKGQPKCPSNIAIGSPKLQEIWDEQNLDIGHVDPNVDELMTLIWKEAIGDIEMYLAEPLENISSNKVEKARAILRIIQAEFASNDEEKLTQLFADFGEIISLRHTILLQTHLGIAQILEMLQLVQDMIALKESVSSGRRTDAQTKYKALRCFIQHHPSHSEEFSNVNKLVAESSKVPLIVKNVYTVRRNVENVGFGNGLRRKRLLFHGSETKNYVGILSRGLILPNKVTSVRGDNRSDVGFLGQGIYFSPSATASASYSKPGNVKGTRLMVLAEVALGEAYQTRCRGNWLTPPDGYQSIHGVATNEMEDSEFQEDEFAIFNLSQQRLKYLIEFNFPTDVEVRALERDIEHEPITTVPSVLQPTLLPRDIMGKVLYAEPVRPKAVGLVSGGFKFPTKSMKIVARLVDLAGQVCIFQEYENPREIAMEAKYIFPLDELAAVCGFEAFINGKHIVGEVKEKEEARKEYVQAISEGHGAYMMDEEKPSIFVVSVGNLPAKAKVLIKITYVTELTVEREQIVFHLPGNVSVQQHQIELSKGHRDLSSCAAASDSSQIFSLVTYVEMPFDIAAITSPTHNILTKKTATTAMVKVSKNARLNEGFQLYVMLAKTHVPRMWIEESADDSPEACMLTFFPNFECEDVIGSTILIFLDTSDSMSGENCQTAQQIALLCLRNLPPECKFNITLFGTAYQELFITPQEKTPETDQKAQEFIMRANGDWGNSELLRAMLSTYLVPPEAKGLRNLFIISDGFLSNVGETLRNVERFHLDARIFTFGVGSMCNGHLLKLLAVKGAGVCEIFEKTTMSTWEKKVKCQVSKSARPVLTNVRVEWQQFNNLPYVQAPRQLVSLFSGERHVVYGFVPNCSMATLKANMNGMEISTIVSASRTDKTSGLILHRLTARAVIRDYESGNLDDDRVDHEVCKRKLDGYVLELGKKFNLVTLKTSFIAVERRGDEDEPPSQQSPSIDELFDAEAEDVLAYIPYNGEEKDVPDDDVQLVHVQVEPSEELMETDENATEIEFGIVPRKKSKRSCKIAVEEEPAEPTFKFGVDLSAYKKLVCAPRRIESTATKFYDSPPSVMPCRPEASFTFGGSATPPRSQAGSSVFGGPPPPPPFLQDGSSVFGSVPLLKVSGFAFGSASIPIHLHATSSTFGRGPPPPPLPSANRPSINDVFRLQSSLMAQPTGFFGNHQPQPVADRAMGVTADMASFVTRSFASVPSDDTIDWAEPPALTTHSVGPTLQNYARMRQNGEQDDTDYGLFEPGDEIGGRSRSISLSSSEEHNSSKGSSSSDESRDVQPGSDEYDLETLLKNGKVGEGQFGGVPLCAELLQLLITELTGIPSELRSAIIQVQNVDCSKTELSALMTRFEPLCVDQGDDDDDFETDPDLGSTTLSPNNRDYKAFVKRIEETVAILKRDGLNSLGKEAASVIVKLIETIVALFFSSSYYAYIDLEADSLHAAATISRAIRRAEILDRRLIRILKGLTFVNWANARYPLAYQALDLRGNWETAAAAIYNSPGFVN